MMRNFELETYFSKWEFTARHHMTASDMESMDVQSLLAMAGAGEGIYASMRALLTKSDHIIVIVPNYQSAESVPLDICQVSGVTIRHENNWHLDIDDIKQAIRPNTKIISINFPHNPTGAVMPIDDLDTLVALCRQKGIYLAMKFIVVWKSTLMIKCRKSLTFTKKEFPLTSSQKLMAYLV
jgi:aspartate/methionine/tyrosine aminotransferase